ncbi:uncharacterized protein LOC129107336 isoform X2 [Anoplopoma fimbria]|uniref:uncharacterized protein LOC129107336 isoform X2 n=1 Tax=Anoplopoma fimbria TaxID=229290 RepID=UPI0023EBB915|nr:uncharacterized protein LOC129107336 isoform X2 [Anoplopoma fimbria]
MDTKGLLGLILTFVLQFQAVISRTDTSLFFRSGEDAALRCADASPTGPTCSLVSWLRSINQYRVFPLVENGIVASSSAQASRLSLDTECSLVIQNITAQDAGYYTCRLGRDVNLDEHIFTNVLTISPSPPDADPKRDGEVTLECTLWRYIDVFHCLQDSLRWVDETGSVLLDEGVGYSFLRQTNCVSVLTVKRQSGHTRRYTCQFVDQNRVEIEAEYTPDFTGGKTSDPDVPADHMIIIGAVVVAVVVLAVMVAVVIKYRKRAKVTEDVERPTEHAVKEEDATYSTIDTLVRTEAGDVPNCIYSYVSNPRIN